MKWRVVLIIVTLFAFFGFIFLKTYPSTTGKFIFWQNSDFSDSANPSLHLSPLPVQAPLTGVSSVTINCQEAKKSRDAACNAFFDKYAEGCKWYHLAFSFAFDCKDLRNSCSQAEEKVSNECK